MKRNKEYILKTIAGESVLVPVGKASAQLNGMIHLTETAAFIWNHIDECPDLDAIVSLMQEEYEVTPDQARIDVYGFVRELAIRGIVTGTGGQVL